MCGWFGGWFVLRFPELRVDWRVYWWICCMDGWFYAAFVFRCLCADWFGNTVCWFALCVTDLLGVWPSGVSGVLADSFGWLVCWSVD